MCDDNYYSDTYAATECKVCPDGFTCQDGKITDLCPKGKYCRSGASAAPCPVGYYNPNDGASITDTCAGKIILLHIHRYGLFRNFMF